MTRPTLKQPNQPDPSFDCAMIEYLAQFEYKVTLRLGASYSAEFKEFTEWCTQRLGVKYKDWFMYAQNKGTYTLFCRNNKWAIFLALTYVDKIA